MNPFVDITIFAAMWTYVYMTTADVVKLMSKHAIYLSEIVALYEGGVLYGNALFALMAFVIVLWVFNLFFDYMDAIRKPSEGMMNQISKRG